MPLGKEELQKQIESMTGGGMDFSKPSDWCWVNSKGCIFVARSQLALFGLTKHETERHPHHTHHLHQVQAGVNLNHTIFLGFSPALVSGPAFAAVMSRVQSMKERRLNNAT